MTFSGILSIVESLAVTVSAIVSVLGVLVACVSLGFSAWVVFRERAEKNRVLLEVFFKHQRSNNNMGRIVVRVSNYGLSPMQPKSVGYIENNKEEELVLGQGYVLPEGTSKFLSEKPPLKTNEIIDILPASEVILKKGQLQRFWVEDITGKKRFTSKSDTRKALQELKEAQSTATP